MLARACKRDLPGALSEPRPVNAAVGAAELPELELRSAQQRERDPEGRKCDDVEDPLVHGGRGSALDHLGQVLALPVGVALEGGAVAARQERCEQFAHGRGVASFGQRVTDVPEQCIGHGCGRFGQPGERAEQDIVQAGPAGPPRGQAQQFAAPGQRRCLLPPGACLGFHQRPGQCRDEHRVVSAQADVGDADLQCGIALGQARVEVHHPGVQERTGADHLRHCWAPH